MNSPQPIEEFDDGYDEEWACTWCCGDGYAQVADPLVDDCDEWGYGKCGPCGGSGLRKHQTIF